MCLVSPVMIRSAIVTGHIEALTQRNTGRRALSAYGERQQQEEEVAKAVHEAKLHGTDGSKEVRSWACRRQMRAVGPTLQVLSRITGFRAFRSCPSREMPG